MVNSLAQIQKALKAPKGQENKFGNYKYRSCEDILEALKPLLADDDIFYISDDIAFIGDRFYVKATVNFNNIIATAYARESLDKKGMDSAQITGATSSYARKYALNAMFAIDDTKDADATNTHGKDAKSPNGVLKALDGSPQDAGFKNAAEMKVVYKEKLEKLKAINDLHTFNKAKKIINYFIERLAVVDAIWAESFRNEVEMKEKQLKGE